MLAAAPIEQGDPASPALPPPVDAFGPADQVYFEARAARWLPAARSIVHTLYGTVVDADEFTDRLLGVVEQAARRRKPSLRRLDAMREANPEWFQSERMIGYVAYADRFGGTLHGVQEHLGYLNELSVTYLHLMKVLEARTGANDGGYAIVDYGDVEPSLGTRADLEDLADHLRDNGISLCLDVVMNHTAREHPWAEAARQGSRHHRDYYLVFDDRTMPDRYEASLPEVFPEMAPGNFTFDEAMQAWVWTTFNTYQWDLNYANPEVFVEMLEVMLELANLGVDVLRLDAIAFTWKRLGTNCQNQPEAHLIAQAYRALLAIAAPATLLKAEAIVAPADLLPYLGVHRLERAECHLAYHNQLMVMLWSALATNDARLATEAMAALPPTPASAGWVTYLRCHDDIGWAVSDGDAARVGISAPAHRAYLAAFYRGDFPGSYALGAPFSSNPEAADERTSGTAAALCGISEARQCGDHAALELAIKRLLVCYGVVIGFGGIPLVYMGDELALDNDVTYLDDPALADDSRWMHRPPMPWHVAAARELPGTVEHRVFRALAHLIEVRKATPAMASGGSTYIHRLDDTALFAWARHHPRRGRFYGIANLTDRPATVTAEALRWAQLDAPVELLGTGELTNDGHTITVAPYGMGWFVDQLDAPL